jgi:argonaute-like protein implicated in RNA metabolism and viral defense
MAYVIMAVLAKTGNVPFALAEPLAYADYVVGLNIIRHRMTKGDRVAALARIYRSDGELVRYAMEMLELEHDEPLPFIVLQTVLPCTNLKVSALSYIMMARLTVTSPICSIVGAKPCKHPFILWKFCAMQCPASINLEQTIAAPSWGAFFRLNDDECLVVASDVAENRTPKPLYIRSQSSELPIESAAYSVLAWTLLHYGSSATHKVPVTIQHDDDLRHWLARGILPEQTEGDVPFWL